ncbi:MAG: hypothetical protein A2015_10540 [Spirochaetes bacterium GWF1_31_7]|nr:MAG: hypothetical protein A2Y30_16280 [Spirochaetes bacterium GWE1_32_154]OHD48536.1 MAG: hypothetical protein A2Y29_14255 [Spirochaetes bacterium GWE2_31_10]OHD51451.1 MAG: hypothetical protein A2015_10540 [Spirochaetes bacterium GWF1_31_7]HBD93334.1 hypothetical protein [Spirochaetia bacterium]HBI36665.1 hypothetical protein [Spirochaetia bacterium]
MLESNLTTENETVIEYWIKPPKLVTYTNSKFISHEKNTLVCEFLFPKKYYEKDFYLNGQKVLHKNEMYRGKRFFYADRFYSLLEFYSDDNILKAYYFDISLPAIFNTNSVLVTDIKLDIFYLIETDTIFLLDDDEFNEAVRDNLFTKNEIEASEKTAHFIVSCILRNKINEIFTDYEKTDPSLWERYNNNEYINLIKK